MDSNQLGYILPLYKIKKANAQSLGTIDCPTRTPNTILPEMLQTPFQMRPKLHALFPPSLTSKFTHQTPPYTIHHIPYSKPKPINLSKPPTHPLPLSPNIPSNTLRTRRPPHHLLPLQLPRPTRLHNASIRFPRPSCGLIPSCLVLSPFFLCSLVVLELFPKGRIFLLLLWCWCGGCTCFFWCWFWCWGFRKIRPDRRTFQRMRTQGIRMFSLLMLPEFMDR
jgi:hypothetical protein